MRHVADAPEGPGGLRGQSSLQLLESEQKPYLECT
jgi:hypothetical protein